MIPMIRIPKLPSIWAASTDAKVRISIHSTFCADKRINQSSHDSGSVFHCIFKVLFPDFIYSREDLNTWNSAIAATGGVQYLASIFRFTVHGHIMRQSHISSVTALAKRAWHTPVNTDKIRWSHAAFPVLIHGAEKYFYKISVIFSTFQSRIFSLTKSYGW